MTQYATSKPNRIFALPEEWMEREITPVWDNSLCELKNILLEWTQGARSVWVFSCDDPFLSPINPFKHANCFKMEGHDILIVCPEELTVEFLHAAFFYGSPIEIFKTLQADQYIQDAFVKSILSKEQRLRDSDFSLRVLFDFFGEFIAVIAWSYLYKIEEKDLCSDKS